MDWERLPPIVLEKILYFAADHEEFTNVWLMSMEKFGRVCSYWRKVILSSKTLFPLDKSCLYYDEDDENFDAEAVNRMLETGYFPVVKTLVVYNVDVLKNLQAVNANKDNSLTRFYFQLSADESDNYQDQYILLIHFINSLGFSNVDFFCVRISSLIKLHYQYIFWDLMIKMIHTNSKPKTLQFHIYGIDPLVSWAGLNTNGLNTNFAHIYPGQGSVKTLLVEFEQMFTREHKSFPDWSGLTDVVKVEEVMVIQHGNIHFVYPIQTDCFKMSLMVALRFTDLGPAGPMALFNLKESPVATWFRSFKKFVLLEDVPWEPMIEDSPRIMRFFQDLGCRDVSFEPFPDHFRRSWQILPFRTPIYQFENLALDSDITDTSDSETSD